LTIIILIIIIIIIIMLRRGRIQGDWLLGIIHFLVYDILGRVAQSV